MNKQFPAWTYPAKITSIHDGDSIWIYFYRGVNEAHQKHGIEAKKRAEELLLDKEGIFVTTYKRGSFRDYAEIMKEEGFQKKDFYPDSTD